LGDPGIDGRVTLKWILKMAKLDSSVSGQGQVAGCGEHSK